MEILEKAKTEYPSADTNGKSLLKRIFGEDAFKNNSDWIELFQNFCKKNNLTITYDYSKRKEAGYAYLPHEKLVDAEDEHENASCMIRKIIALNNKEKNFIPDYKNKSQRRWFPVGEMTEAGLVFSHTFYEYWGSSTLAFVGSPFVSPTSDEAKRLFVEYLSIYEKYLIVTQ
ncbi:MAG: hypothetical protein HY063_03240 [Bacteroidetes bacterium]|nr:hypothetical protein [Bacteroidota bacterium]